MAIGDDVVDIVRPQGSGKAEIVDLNPSGTLREHERAVAAKITVQIDQNVYLTVPHQGGGAGIADIPDWNNAMHRGFDAPSG